MGELQLLVGGRQGLAGVVQLGHVEAGGQAYVVVDAELGRAVEADAALAPGGGDDAGLHLVAYRAVIDRRLVVAVDEAERHQEQAGADIGGVRDLIVQIGLLDLGLALVAGAGDGVLDLELAVEADAVAEAVAEEQHEALEVGLVAAAVLQIGAIGDLAVAADGGGAGGLGFGCRWLRRLSVGGEGLDGLAGLGRGRRGRLGRNLARAAHLGCLQAFDAGGLGGQLRLQQVDLSLERRFVGQGGHRRQDHRGGGQEGEFGFHRGVGPVLIRRVGVAARPGGGRHRSGGGRGPESSGPGRWPSADPLRRRSRADSR